MKRFYTEVTTQSNNGFFHFYLDGKPIKTPMGQDLKTTSEYKAIRIVNEWKQQKDAIQPNAMPFTKMLNSVIDQTIPQQDAVIDNLRHYAQFDCLFHFCPEDNTVLFRQQIDKWLPPLQKFEKIYDVKLNFDSSLLIDKQPEKLSVIVTDFLESLTPEELTAMYKIITTLGSVVLSILLFNDHLEAYEALEISRLEEDYNISQWGLDQDTEKSRNMIDVEYKNAIEFLR